MKNEGDIRLSIRQVRKLYVLEEVTCWKITNREASALVRSGVVCLLQDHYQDPEGSGLEEPLLP